MKRMASIDSKRALLADAMREKKLVRLTRPFESTKIEGYVLDIGPVFFLFALVCDRLWFDGFECFRLADIKTVVPAPYAIFVENALKLRGERIPKRPRVELSDIENLLLSAGRAFPLVAIHREKLDPDVC